MYHVSKNSQKLVHFGATLGPLWGHLGHFGATLDPLWGTLGVLCGHFGMIWALLSSHFGTTLTHFGVTLVYGGHCVGILIDFQEILIFPMNFNNFIPL